MSYVLDVANNPNFQTNLVVEIDGTFFSRYTPDSGLVVEDKNLIVDGVTINPTKVYLREGSSTINSTTVKVLDEDGVFSTFIGTDDGALIGKELKVYLGRILAPYGDSLDFGDYLLVNTYEIASISKRGTFYNIKGRSVKDELQVPVFDAEASLASSITGTDTSIVVETEEDIFTEATGFIKLEDEVIEYNAVSFDSINEETTFTVAARGSDNSTAAPHDAGSITTFLYRLEENPIDMLLRLLISSGGGGTYDTYPDGAGIDESLIDITEFENIRDTFFSGRVFGPFFISNEENLLKWIEPELLRPNNIRLVENAVDNKLSLAILDQSDLSADVPNVDEFNTKANPGWKIDKNEIINVVKIKYGWSEGLNKFTRVKTFPKDLVSDSITKYGVKKGETLEFKGIQTINAGDSIASDTARRYLERFSTPRVEIDCESFMDASLYKVGDKVRFSSSTLPQEGGGLGISSIVEIISRGVNFQTGFVKLKLRFTSYSNLRIGVISPSPSITTAPAQNQITVPDGTQYEAGYACVLWDRITCAKLSDPINVIESIDGNVLTFEDDWTTILPNSDVYLFFADYNNSSAQQQARYIYNAPNTNFFDDGTKAYQIIL